MNVIVREPNPYRTRELSGEVMSNFDHIINEEVAQELQETEAFSRYPGRDFNGQVWWERKGKQWCCAVWIYHEHVDTMYAPDLEELMTVVRDKYGWD